MKKAMMTCSLVSLLLTAGAATGYAMCHGGWLLTLAVTAGTVCYHFAMRLLVGAAWIPMEQHIDPDAAWYRERRFEPALYKALRVKTWKHHVPSFDPDTFDIKQHSLQELLCATCHSERVHETIILLSFVPVFGCVWFGSAAAFILTSVGAALIDSVFVVVQRYNRPRLRRLIKRQQKQTM